MRAALVEPGEARAGPRRARPCGSPTARCGAWCRRPGRSWSGRPSGTARRSRGWWPAGCAARGEASATNRRMRASDAVRAPNACSICASIPLSAAPSRPTSVCSGAAGTRWDRSPSAIAAAVVSISRSGRSDRRTAHAPAAAPSSTMPRPLSSRTSAHVPRRCASMSPSGRATTTEPPRARRRRRAGRRRRATCEPARRGRTVNGSPWRASACVGAEVGHVRRAVPRRAADREMSALVRPSTCDAHVVVAGRRAAAGAAAESRRAVLLASCVALGLRAWRRPARRACPRAAPRWSHRPAPARTPSRTVTMPTSRVTSGTPAHRSRSAAGAGGRASARRSPVAGAAAGAVVPRSRRLAQQVAHAALGVDERGQPGAVRRRRAGRSCGAGRRCRTRRCWRRRPSRTARRGRGSATSTARGRG